MVTVKVPNKDVTDDILKFFVLFLAHLSTKCSGSAVVISQCLSSVFHLVASVIALKAYSYIPGPMDSKLGKEASG